MISDNFIIDYQNYDVDSEDFTYNDRCPHYRVITDCPKFETCNHFIERRKELSSPFKVFFNNHNEYVCNSCNNIQIGSLCPNCKSKVTLLHEEKREINFYDLFNVLHLKIYTCKECGWWKSLEQFLNYSNWDWPDYKIDAKHNHKNSIPKRFNLKDKDLPITSLVEELKKDKKIMYSIHDKKMEELVKYVFESYYKCNVKLVGKSGDNGIDLIMIDSDEPILIQVKRRTKENHVESISSIREFIGALILQQQRKGIFVSTAKSYSIPAQKAAHQIVDQKNLDYFDLFDFKRFCETLNIVKKGDKNSIIEKIIEEWINNTQHFV